MGILDVFSSMLDYGYRPRLQEQRKAALDQMIQEGSVPMQGAKPMSEILQAYGELNPGVWGDSGFQNMHRAALQNESNMNAQSKADETARVAAEGAAYDQSMARELQPLQGAEYERALANYTAQAPAGSRYYGKAAELVKAPGDTEIKRADTLLANVTGQQNQVAQENRAEGRRTQQQRENMATPGINLTGQGAVDFQTRLDGATRAQQTVLDVNRLLEKSDLGEVAISPVQRQVAGTAIQADMLPYLQKRFAAGAMQKGEQELFSELAGDPTAIFAWTPKQRATLKFWAADAQRERENLHRMQGTQAPPVAEGQSVFARSLTPVQPKGATRAWTPGAR